MSSFKYINISCKLTLILWKNYCLSISGRLLYLIKVIWTPFHKSLELSFITAEVKASLMLEEYLSGLCIEMIPKTVLETSDVDSRWFWYVLAFLNSIRHHGSLRNTPFFCMV